MSKIDGRSLRKRPWKERFDEKWLPHPRTGCWFWIGGRTKRGYGLFMVRKGSNDGAHRVAYRRWVGPIPAGLHVLHKCDRPSCVNPDHLWLGTRSDNMRDMHMKQRGRAKLTHDQVRIIRSDARPVKVVAREYGLTDCAVYKIRRREVWKDVA